MTTKSDLFAVTVRIYVRSDNIFNAAAMVDDEVSRFSDDVDGFVEHECIGVYQQHEIPE